MRIFGIILIIIAIFFSLPIFDKGEDAFSKKSKFVLGIFVLIIGVGGIALATHKTDAKPTKKEATSSSVSIKNSSSSSTVVDENTVSQMKTDLTSGDTKDFLKLYYDQSDHDQLEYFNRAEVGTTDALVNGTAFQTNSAGTRLYIYVPVEAPKTGWNDIVNTKQNAYVVIAKADEGTFSDENVGKNVTVSGRLTSRGSLSLGYNWDLYDAQLTN